MLNKHNTDFVIPGIFFWQKYGYKKTPLRMSKNTDQIKVRIDVLYVLRVRVSKNSYYKQMFPWKFSMLATTVDFFYWYPQKQRPEVFYRKGVHENVAKFTENHMCQSLFFNKNCRLKLNVFNPLLHKMGPRISKSYIFSQYYRSQYSANFMFYIFLHSNSIHEVNNTHLIHI